MSLRFYKGKKKPLLASVVTENHGPCAFCQYTVDDEISYGKLYAIGDVQCHYFCALLSCCLIQKGNDEEGLFGFLYPDIVAEIERSRKHRCSYCGKGGASLGCSITTCRKQFHLPCGRRHNAVSLFYGNYKSFCIDHVPKQKIPAHIMGPARIREKSAKAKAHKAPKTFAGVKKIQENDELSEETVCVICYEEVQGFPTVETFWPPCCGRDAWFHRSCLTRMALSAGMHYLKCPLCNDKDTFYDAVVDQGYYVPDRDAAWELEQNAFAEIYERPLACAADNCQCPNGREHDTDTGPWDIKLCILCGTIGMHAQCLTQPNERFMCVTCKPLAPDDLDTFTTTIEQEILREQASKAAENVPRGPVMPSRMSLRRTKPRNISLPSTSGALKKKEAPGIVSAPETPTLASSRLELNLKTPRRCRETDASHLQLGGHILQNIENTLLTPIKMLQQALNEKFRNMPIKVDSEKMIAKLRQKFKKPRPRSAKMKIVNAILEGILDYILIENKIKSPVKMWNSPKKSYESLASPKKSLVSPKNSLVSPKKSFASPNKSCESPKKSFASPNKSYESPKKSLASPNKSFASPNKSYESPKKSLASPNKSYESPKKSLASPNKSYESPKKSLASPNKSYESPKKSLGSPNKSHESPNKSYESPKKSLASPKLSLVSPKITHESPKKAENLHCDIKSSKTNDSINTPTKNLNITPNKKPLDNLILMHTEIIGDTVNEVRFEDIIDLDSFKEKQSNYAENGALKETQLNCAEIKQIDNRRSSGPIGKVLEIIDENCEQNNKDEQKTLFLKEVDLSPIITNIENAVPVGKVLEIVENDISENYYEKKQNGDQKISTNMTPKNRKNIRKSLRNTPQSSEYNNYKDGVNDRNVTPIRKTRNSTPKSAPGKISNEVVQNNDDTEYNYPNSTPKSNKNKINKKSLVETLKSLKNDPIGKILEIYDDDSENFEDEARFVKTINNTGEKTEKTKPRKLEEEIKNVQNGDRNSEIAEDSKNSADEESFGLPLAGCIAENNSKENVPFLESLKTPKKLKTVDIQKDSSLEISKNKSDSAINIDMIKNENNSEILNIIDIKSPVKTKKCALKFSPTDKEKMTLQKTKVDIDMEIFKNHYLNEVGKHDKNQTDIEITDSEERGENTVIDFDIDASYRERDRKKLKRKLKSKGVIAKKRLKKNRNKNIEVKFDKSDDSDLEILCSKNETLDLTVETVDKKSERRKKLKKKNKKHLSRDNIRVKIRLKITKSSGKSPKEKNIEKIKKKVVKPPESPSKLKQYILKYPTESSKMICKPDNNIQGSPKKRSYKKMEKAPDNLVQTSIQSFFKLKPKD